MNGSAVELAQLRHTIVNCWRCPELRRYCADVAARGKREFAGEKYWGKPLPSLGDTAARLLIVGLAPAAHGGNRTGRMFTGDSSGIWLARALYENGFATTPFSRCVGDGYELKEAFITAALRCAPPMNKPTLRQLNSCAPYMRAELELLPRLRVGVGLGKIGFEALVRRLSERGYASNGRRPHFAHNIEHCFLRTGGSPLTVIGCFHPSRQNTNTGKLSRDMLQAVFRRARELVDMPEGNGA